ncbi:MAG TPA: FAD-dependent monooxygenase, partial [Candidatus Thermoplasmatota archaeon]|nr:FAD-dependent monooxygenase [Candidatus Thermoplasmatota archaeon]
AAVARPFAGWWGPIERLIRATPDERVLRNDIFVRPPDRAWGRGRVTLLGDAAHLMTPDLGQGACQAMIDAVTLARVLKDSQGQHVPERLRGYEALRIPQCELVARRSYKLGRSAHMASRPGVALRNAIMRAIPAGLQAARLRRVIERSMG